MKKSMMQFLILFMVGWIMFGSCQSAVANVLVEVAEQGDLEKVKRLVEVQGVQVDEQDSDSQTALMRASSKGHVNVVKYLLEKGADVNLKETKYGETALKMAAESGHSEVVEVLLKNGADDSAENKYGVRALTSAAMAGKIRSLQALLASGAEIDHKGGKGGRTALMNAYFWGQLEAARFLISKGANISIKDEGGKTAKDWARGDFFDMVENNKTSGKLIKYTVYITFGGTSIGGYKPEGMRQYEILVGLENFSDADARVGLGPLELVDVTGKTYAGIINRGPTQVFSGGIEMVLGEISGNATATISLKPKEVVKRIHIFANMPDNTKPKEITIVLGNMEPRKVRVKYPD